MIGRDYAYVATQFDHQSIKPFVDLTSQIIKPNDLYISDQVTYVKGDVSKLLHMTVFYGLIDEEIDFDEINKFCKLHKLNALKLGGLSLKNDYSGLCQILWVDVLDFDGSLKTLSDSFKSFRYKETVQFEFIPHLTLAYVKLDYKLPVDIPKYPKRIKVQKVRYFMN